MSDSTAVVESPAAATSPAPAEPSGQAPSTPTAADKPAASPAAPPDQAPSTPAPKYRFKDQAEAERSHSELQRRYSKLGDPEQAAQRLGLMTALQADPKFQEWAKARLAEQETGSGDPETVKALELVRNLARAEAQQMVAPLQAQAAAANLAGIFQAMTQKHGPEWQEMRQRMGELFQEGIQQGIYSQNPNFKPTLQFVDGLYRLARSEDPEWAAKEYQKRLQAKQATSTQSTPGVAPAATVEPQGKGMANAYRAALKELRMG